MTTHEVMALLRVNRATLCRYCRKGQIPYVRMPDSSYRFHATTIQEWVIERTFTPA